jgi:hypothetical protein
MDTVDHRSTQPLDAAEAEQLIGVAKGIIIQARNLGVAMGRDPDIMSLAVMTRAAADAVCDVAGLEATPMQLAQLSTALATRIIAAVGAVQAERGIEAGVAPWFDQDDEAQAFTETEGDG